MPKPFDPYHTWLGIRPEEQPPNYYRLLALQPLEDNPDTIEHAADQRMAHLRTLQAGKYAVECQRLLNEVATAKVCLLTPARKAAYDAQLQAQLGVSPPSVSAAWSASPPPVPSSQMGALAPAGVEAGAAGPAPSGTSAIEEDGFVAPAVRPRLSPARRRGSPAAVIAALTLGVLLVMGVVLWASLGGNNPFGSRSHELGQGPTAKTRQPNDKTSDAKDQPPADKTAKPDKLPATGDGKSADPQDSKADPTAKPDRPAAEPDKGKPEAPVVPTPSEKEPPKEQTPPPSDPPAVPVAEKPKRATVPSAAVQQQIRGQLEEVYKLTSSTPPAEKLKIANDLLGLAKKKSVPSDERFVMLRKAMELAGDAGDAAVMLGAVDAMAADFEIDPLAVKEGVLTKFAEKATEADRIKSLVETSRAVIDQAVAERRYELALSLATAVNKACQRSTGREYRKETFDRRQEIQKLFEQWQQVQQALASLQEHSDDPAANLVLGRWWCFRQEDWKQGLPYLAKGSDEGLKAAAAQELGTSATTAEEQINRGDAWWDLAAERKGEEKLALLKRAGYWYQQAAEKASSGIALTKLEKRLAEIAQQVRPPEPAPAAKPARPAEPAAKPGTRKSLTPDEVAKMFGLGQPGWSIEGETLTGTVGRTSDAGSNPLSLTLIRASSLEFGFKIKSRWYQTIHVVVDDHRFSYTRGHGFGFTGRVDAAGAEDIRMGDGVASPDEWYPMSATLKDDTLTLYYNGRQEWSGKVPAVRGGKHSIRVGFGSWRGTVSLKDFYIEAN